MSVTASELTQYADKRVTLVRNLAKPNEKGETAEELEGTVAAVAGDAIMFKPKGKTNALLIEVDEIESIDFAKDKGKTLSRKVLKIVTYGQARTHLLERHGWTLAAINETSEADAFRLHNEIDHEAADLGHVHKDKDEASSESEDSASDEE